MGKTFEFHGNEEEKFNAFCEKHQHPEADKGAIGGHISFRFTLTSIGDMPTVRCGVCGEEENITDYDIL